MSLGVLARHASWTTALWGMVVLGIVVRVVRYAADRSLWGDEGALALNIVQRSPRELLEPLDYVQGAPTGFLLVEKGITYVLGEDELALRLFPLLCGVAALVLSALIARRLLRIEAATLATALVALSEPLVYYSSEVKQYETDVLVALVLLYGALAVDWSAVRLPLGAAIAFGGVVAVWFSHAAFLVLPSLYAVLLASAWLRREPRAVRVLLRFGVVWAASSLAAYLVNRNNADAVADAALGTTGSSGQGVGQPLRNAWDLYDTVVGVANSTSGLAIVLAVAGLLVLWRRHPTATALLVAPGFAAFLAAIADQYPFSDRFVLFLAPALIIFVSGGAVALVSELPRSFAPLRVVVLVLLLIYPVGVAADHTLSPPGHEEVKAVLRTVEREWRSGDALHVWYQSQHPFRYYAECDGCDVLGDDGPASVVWPPAVESESRDSLQTREPTLYLSRAPHDLDSYLPSLERLDGKPRAWFLFSSTWDDSYARLALDCMGERLVEARARRAVAYLYDLDAPATGAACG